MSRRFVEPFREPGSGESWVGLGELGQLGALLTKRILTFEDQTGWNRGKNSRPCSLGYGGESLFFIGRG